MLDCKDQGQETPDEKTLHGKAAADLRELCHDEYPCRQSTGAVGGRRTPCCWWVYPRENFRMPREAFFFGWWNAYSLDSSAKAPPCGNPSQWMSVLAIAIWWMANMARYQVVSNQFRIARSTIMGIVVEVCQVMEAELLCTTVCPTTEVSMWLVLCIATYWPLGQCAKA